MDELVAGLRVMLESDADCEAAVRAVAGAIKAAGADAEITEDDGEPDDLDNDDALWVVSDHALVVDGETVAKWTRCSIGTYGEAGRQCSEDDWCVSEDTNGGGVTYLCGYGIRVLVDGQWVQEACADAD